MEPNKQRKQESELTKRSELTPAGVGVSSQQQECEINNRSVSSPIGGHLPEEEGEQKGADVRAVHVRVGQYDDFAVPQLGRAEVFVT
eukprot:1220107-Pyramimonas_sp.AAC.1